MHNIKDIRANLENFVKTISKRNHKVDQSLLISLDTKNRDLIQKKENLEQEKKIISKSKDKSLFEKSKKLSNYNGQSSLSNAIWIVPIKSKSSFGISSIDT